MIEYYSFLNVKDDIKFWLNEQIRNNNQEVPSKYQDIQRFKISYAYRIEKNKVIPLVDSTLFNYLPLSISLGFPFLVNSDFIPEGDREELYLNVWNEFLMIEIGKYLPVFISDLVGKKVDCFNLLPDLKVENLNNSKWGQLYKWFSQGFEESLIGQNAIAFIPTQCGTLETISNILIDETGLADLLGEDFFKLTGIKAKLINSEVGEGIEKIKAILSEDDQGVYTIEKLKVDIKSKFGDWLKIPQNNFKIIHHFYVSKNLKGLLETEAIILTTKNILGMASDVYESGPDLVDLIDFKRVNDDLLILLTINNISLNLKVFNPVDFYNENIWGKHDSINKKLDNEIDLLNFWNFIYDYWNEFGEVEGIKVSIKLFKILCKSLNNESLYSNVITTVYLSAGFNTENEIESVITEIGIQDAKFTKTELEALEQINKNKKWLTSTAVKEASKLLVQSTFKKLSLPQIVRGMYNLSLKHPTKFNLTKLGLIIGGVWYSYEKLAEIYGIKPKTTPTKPGQKQRSIVKIVSNYDKDWDYKMDGDNFYAKKKGSEEWVLTKGKISDTIKSKVFGIEKTPEQIKLESEYKANKDSIDKQAAIQLTGNLTDEEKNIEFQKVWGDFKFE